jgi:serine/threonine protein kinase
MALTSGTKLWPYEIVSPIGAGGMGEVYRARDTRLGRDVAIKVLPEALAQDADRLRRFEQEARAIAALNHPNILGIHDIGAHDGAPFLVSEFLEGQTLREKLAPGPLPRRLAIEYALGIAEGLAAAHEKGIVHRDLKVTSVDETLAASLAMSASCFKGKSHCLRAIAPNSAGNSKTWNGRGLDCSSLCRSPYS